MVAQLHALEGRFEAVAQGREAVRLLEEIGSFKAALARESLRAIEARAARAGGVIPGRNRSGQEREANDAADQRTTGPLLASG